MGIRETSLQEAGILTALIWKKLRPEFGPAHLAHCFCCKKNFNNIDLLLTEGYGFRDAVLLLERWLNRYEAQQTKKKTASSPPA